ncbi:MAG: type III pantothenate kinase [Bacteroidetes bacterium]|nr:type III pantothenate kinase [Bacteroidota bacterium]
MKLVIDIGNTLTKIAVFEGKQMLAFGRHDSFNIQYVNQLIAEHTMPSACIISSVSAQPYELGDLSGRFSILEFDYQTKLPFRNRYSTPETLGKDRLAGVAAAFELFPGRDVLVIDAGTAITYDFITSSGEYHGGAISPGIRMRYQALHTFSGRLPLLDSEESAPLTGDSTNMSIHSGVLNGTKLEVEGVIRLYEQQYPGIQVVLTGGDHYYFDKQFKIKTFAAPNLVLDGLNLILNYNLEK